MRQELQNRSVESHGELSSAHFGISTDDQAHIIGILRDRLYSDKIMAVLREYGTNAWDAHVEGGINDKPVKIVLPSRFNPVFRVRDFGPGISEANIYDVYCKYGSSTKRDSNQAVGMLGIGCKSGFAYSDVFTIVSYHGGMKKTYSAFIDDTNLGQMTKLAEVECGDETGIEIQVPVQVADVQYFHAKAKSLYKYFVPRPDINCQLPVRTYTVSGTGWSIRGKTDGDTQQGPVAIMGNIGYPIKTERLNKLPEKLKGLLNTSIDMQFPIGALSIAASREDLEYTDKTTQAIQTTLELCLRELEINLTQALSQAKNVHEARQVFNAATADGEWTWINNSRVHNLSWTVAMGRKMWKGIDLSRQHYEPLCERTDLEVRAILPSEERTIGVGTRRYHNRHPKGRFYYKNNPIIALCDVKSQWIGRAVQLREELQEENPGQYTILIAKFKTDDLKAAQAAYAKWIKGCQLEGTPTFKLSDYEGKDLGRGGSGNSSVRNKKTSKKVFKAKASNYLPHVQAPSDNWEPEKADLENGTGIYVTIHGFRPVGSSNPVLSDQLSNLKAVGVDLTQLEVIGVKLKEATKIGDGWTKFQDWYEEKIEDVVKNNTNTLELLKIQAVLSEVHQNSGHLYENRAQSLLDRGLAKDHSIVRHFMDVSEVLQVRKAWTAADTQKAAIIYSAVAKLPDAKRPKVSYSVRERAVKLIRNYPMLQHSNIFNMPYWGYYNTPSTDKVEGRLDNSSARTLVEYIQLVDANRKNP